MLARLRKEECQVAEAAAEGPGMGAVPPKRHMLAGGSSLAATGLQMSQERRAGGNEAEPDEPLAFAWQTQSPQNGEASRGDLFARRSPS
eukprot:1660573-Alexandrium_andersonii.AAC.1